MVLKMMEDKKANSPYKNNVLRQDKLLWIALTIIKDQKTSDTYIRDTINVLKAVAKSPYVVGSDFIGEEINDILELQPAIEQIVKYVKQENQLLRENADTLEGYVVPFEMKDEVVGKIFEDNPEILSRNTSAIYKRF